MKNLLILLAHLLTTVAKLLGPGGARAVVADSLLMKQQLLVINRSRQRAPNLSTLDRFLPVKLKQLLALKIYTSYRLEIHCRLCAQSGIP